MSANYTDEHLANITHYVKEVRDQSHQDAANLYRLIAEQNELLKKSNHYAKWTADVARFYFFLTLLGIMVSLLLTCVHH